MGKSLFPETAVCLATVPLAAFEALLWTSTPHFFEKSNQFPNKGFHQSLRLFLCWPMQLYNFTRNQKIIYIHTQLFRHLRKSICVSASCRYREVSGKSRKPDVKYSGGEMVMTVTHAICVFVFLRIFVFVCLHSVQV